MKLAEKILKEKVDEARPSQILNFAMAIEKSVPMVDTMVDIVSQRDGMVGLYRTKDGNAYEVTIRPAQYAQHDGIQKRTKKR